MIKILKTWTLQNSPDGRHWTILRVTNLSAIYYQIRVDLGKPYRKIFFDVGNAKRSVFGQLKYATGDNFAPAWTQGTDWIDGKEPIPTLPGILEMETAKGFTKEAVSQQ